MKKSSLPDDVSIADIVWYLTDPIEYLRSVVGNMYECKKRKGFENDDPVVRIGTTGKGRAPHYRVERSAVWASNRYFLTLLHFMEPATSNWPGGLSYGTNIGVRVERVFM